MSKQQLRITCTSCSNRRVKARTQGGRKTTKCLCQSCYDSDKAAVFFGSSAGDWFLKRAIDHCTNSIPQNTDDLILLINLYKETSRAKGWMCIDGKLSSLYDYELCHKDPRKGDGFTGALVAGNLFIGLKSTNRKMTNLQPITSYGYRITERGDELTLGNAKAILKDMYDLKTVVDVCGLSRKPNGKVKDFVSHSPIAPSELFSKNLERHGFDTEGLKLPEEYIEEAFQMLNDMPRIFCLGFLKQHGQLEEDTF